MFNCPPPPPLLSPFIRYFPKPTPPPTPLSLFSLPPSPPFFKTTNSTTEHRMENHARVCCVFTILVFQANFMVSVSFMIRGQHQSSGIIRQGKKKMCSLFKKEERTPRSSRWENFFSLTAHTLVRSTPTPNPPPVSVSGLPLLLVNERTPPTCTHNSSV